MVRCWKCGRENEEGMRFCTNCGNSLTTTPPAGPPVGGGAAYDPTQSETISFNPPPQTSPGGAWPTSPYSAAAPPRAESAPKSNKGLVIGIIAAVILLGGLGLAAVAGYYYYQNTTEVSTNNQNTRRGTLDPDSKPTPGKANDNADQKAEPTPSPSSQKSFEPPTVATKEGSFTVYANEGWQLSDIAVVPLERFTTKTDGIVDVAGVKTGVRAGGVADAKFKSRRLYQDYPTGALLMRTRYADGRYSNMQPTGLSGAWENLPEERGMLEFIINDNAPQENGGQFTVKVKLTSVPKQKQ